MRAIRKMLSPNWNDILMLTLTLMTSRRSTNRLRIFDRVWYGSTELGSTSRQLHSQLAGSELRIFHGYTGPIVLAARFSEPEGSVVIWVKICRSTYIGVLLRSGRSCWAACWLLLFFF